jgi:uncharacterized protein
MQAEAGAGPATMAPSRDERQWAMLCHLSAMLMYCTLIGGFIAPFVIWLLKRDEMPFVADQGRETLNFQITTLLMLIASGMLVLMGGVLAILILPLVLVVIGGALVGATLLFHFVITIVATVKVSEGVLYRYPVCWRVLV